MNFDFGQHWDTRIVPLLTTRSIKQCITKAINNFLKDYKPDLKYDKTGAPAWFISISDFYAQAHLDYQNKISAELVKAGQFEEQDEDEDWEDYYDHYLKEKVRPYMDHFERTNIASYQCMGGCFYWNTTFGLQMARLIEPFEDWRVLRNAWHATVVNRDRTKVFDILYYNQNDATRGGAFAISEATRTDPRAPE